MGKLYDDGRRKATGTPVGARGAPWVPDMGEILQRKQANRGIVMLYIWGGQGGALMWKKDEYLRAYLNIRSSLFVTPR